MILNGLQDLPHFQISMSLRRLMTNVQEPKADVFAENEDAVRVLTIHGAKGLEFPVVFLIDAEKGKVEKRNVSVVYEKIRSGSPLRYMFSFKTGADREMAERFFRDVEVEERNLLYVALTRARQGLVITGRHEKNEKTWMDMITKFSARYPRFRNFLNKTIEIATPEEAL